MCPPTVILYGLWLILKMNVTFDIVLELFWLYLSGYRYSFKALKCKALNYLALIWENECSACLKIYIIYIPGIWYLLKPMTFTIDTL